MEESTNFSQEQLKRTYFPTGHRELIFGVLVVICALALFNFIVWGGFNLGFSIAAGLCIMFTAGYLLLSGCKLTPYSAALLGLSLVISAGFARSADGFVKFVMVCFLLCSVNLGLCLLSGQNLRDTGHLSSLLDAPRAIFTMGFGKMSMAFHGLSVAFRHSGSLGQKSGAILVGLLIAVPVLAVMVPLLMFADAAFEGLMDLLPELDMEQIIHTVLWGSGLAVVLYTRGVALRHCTKKEATDKKAIKGIHLFTVNTVLSTVCILYGVYLFSQLAYFTGGFAGLLPKEYTMAQYARRGFFEMAWLCAINLGIIGLSTGLVQKDETAPMSTRLLCLFIGIITLFFVAAASGKMFLYIGGYGLTRLRLLTQIIMLWLGLTTIFVMLHLFLPKFSYMRLTLLCALVIGAVLFWADVDTIVARHNVNAYFSGQLKTVDVTHLGRLSDGAVPYLELLAEQAQGEVAQRAKEILDRQAGRHYGWDDDFRSWNYATATAEPIWQGYAPAEASYDIYES